MIDRTALILGAALALMAAPAIAQEAEAPAAAPDAEKINMVIVYGEDKCEESSADTINVCARLSEGDRYRIPTQLRDDINDPRKEAWTNRVLAYEYVGRDGTMSCSATGAGGFTGCGLKEIDAALYSRIEDKFTAFYKII